MYFLLLSVTNHLSIKNKNFDFVCHDFDLEIPFLLFLVCLGFVYFFLFCVGKYSIKRYILSNFRN